MSIDHIYESLSALSASVEFLEQELVRKETERAQAAKAISAKPVIPATLPQNDLFADWSSPAGKAANANRTSQLAGKLDNAIANVQWLLQTTGA